MKISSRSNSTSPGISARFRRRLGWKMAWNEPGGNGKGDKDKDPWSGNNQDGPPDLDEVVRKMQQKFGGIFGGKKGRGNGRGDSSDPSPFGFYALVFGVLAVMWLAYDMVYTIQEAQRGVVLRFGKYVDTIQPGLNFRLPRPIEKVYKIDVKKIYNFSDKATMLTADENLVQVEVFVQYQIQQPEKYLFDVRWPNANPDSVLRSIMESSVRDVIGKSSMDQVLTEGRIDIAVRTRRLMQEILDEYETGLLISELKLQDARPPEAVKAAFDDAIKAREDEERAKNEAEAYSNDIIPKARGKSARDIADAVAYKAQVIDQAKGDASRFEQLLAEYEKAPAVTRDRLYLETVESVLGNNRKVMIDINSGNNMMYLPLDRLMNQAAGAMASQSNARIETPQTQRQESFPTRLDSRPGVRR
jgi:membrane protease subunit HflK